jgi:hypothetical protein
VNRVSVHNANNPMPTGHGEAGTKLLSSFEDGHYSKMFDHDKHLCDWDYNGVPCLQ